MATNANYVRFIRGTPTAWANLKVKDDDCLYFIAEKNSNAGYLYLGDKLISGSGGGGSGVDASILGRIERLEKKQDLDTNHLKDLQDVTLGTKIADGSSLVYDANTKKWTNKVLSAGGDEIQVGAENLHELKDVNLGLTISDGSVLSYDAASGKWVNIVLEIPEPAEVMKGATEDYHGTSGLVPRPIAGYQMNYLRADGTWANPTEECEAKFALLYGTDSEFLSIRDIANSEVQKIFGKNVPDEYNTIEKIANWIIKNGTSLDGGDGAERLEKLEQSVYGEDKTSQTDGLVKHVKTLNDLVYGFNDGNNYYEGLVPLTNQLQFDVINLDNDVSNLKKNYKTLNTTVTDLSSRLTWRKY